MITGVIYRLEIVTQLLHDQNVAEGARIVTLRRPGTKIFFVTVQFPRSIKTLKARPSICII